MALPEGREEGTASVLEALHQEISRMRSIQHPALAPPPLDFDALPKDASPGSTATSYTPQDVDELSERRHEQMRSSEMAHAKKERDVLEAQLLQRDEEAREERNALLMYIEDLHGMKDAMGDALLGTDFDSIVEKLTSETRAQRFCAEGAVSQEKGLSQLLQSTDDAKLREGLLEVQRLDGVLERALKKSRSAALSARGTRAEGRGVTKAQAADSDVTVSAPTSPGRVSTLAEQPSSSQLHVDGTFLTSTGAAEQPRARSKCPPYDTPSLSLRLMLPQAPSASQLTQTSSCASIGSESRRIGRPLGAIWMSVADEARAKALLEEAAVALHT